MVYMYGADESGRVLETATGRRRAESERPFDESAARSALALQERAVLTCYSLCDCFLSFERQKNPKPKPHTSYPRIPITR